MSQKPVFCVVLGMNASLFNSMLEQNATAAQKLSQVQLFAFCLRCVDLSADIFRAGFRCVLLSCVVCNVFDVVQAALIFVVNGI